MTEKVKEKIAKTLKRRGGKSIDEASGDTLYLIYKFFCGTVARLAVTSIVIVVLSVWGLRCMKIDTALISYFPKESKMRQDIEYVDKSFAGTNSIFFLISGEEKGSITNPELLEAVDNMQSYLLNKYDGIGKIVSLTTFIKRINQVWHVPGTPQSFAAAAQNVSEMTRSAASVMNLFLALETKLTARRTELPYLRILQLLQMILQTQI